MTKACPIRSMQDSISTPSRYCGYERAFLRDASSRPQLGTGRATASSMTGMAQHERHRDQVGLADQVEVERLESPGRLQQQRGRPRTASGQPSMLQTASPQSAHQPAPPVPAGSPLPRPPPPGSPVPPPERLKTSPATHPPPLPGARRPPVPAARRAPPPVPRPPGRRTTCPPGRRTGASPPLGTHNSAELGGHLRFLDRWPASW